MLAPHSSSPEPKQNVQELEPARAIIERIRSRDLYKVVDYKVFPHADREMIAASVTPDAIVEVAKSGVLTGVDEELVAQLKPSHVAVACLQLHYGKKEQNPLDEVTFYTKKKPNGASYRPRFSFVRSLTCVC